MRSEVWSFKDQIDQLWVLTCRQRAGVQTSRPCNGRYIREGALYSFIKLHFMTNVWHFDCQSFRTIITLGDYSSSYSNWVLQGDMFLRNFLTSPLKSRKVQKKGAFCSENSISPLLVFIFSIADILIIYTLK